MDFALQLQISPSWRHWLGLNSFSGELPPKLATTPSASPRGTPGQPARLPGPHQHRLLHEETRSSLPLDPLTDNPTTCTGKALITSLEVQTYQDPEHLSEAQSSYPPIEECDREAFKPLLQASPTSVETDSPSGLNLEMSAQQFEGYSRVPVGDQIDNSHPVFPPDDQPRRRRWPTACTNAEANFGSEGPAECPDNAKIGTVSIGSPTLNGPLTGSVYLGQPEPGNQYRLFQTSSLALG